MTVGYPVIERWRVDCFFLHMYGCWISSDRKVESCSVFFYICMAVRYPAIDRWGVIQSFLYMYGCWISSDGKMEG